MRVLSAINIIFPYLCIYVTWTLIANKNTFNFYLKMLLYGFLAAEVSNTLHTTIFSSIVYITGNSSGFLNHAILPPFIEEILRFITIRSLVFRFQIKDKLMTGLFFAGGFFFVEHLLAGLHNPEILPLRNIGTNFLHWCNSIFFFYMLSGKRSIVSFTSSLLVACFIHLSFNTFVYNHSGVPMLQLYTSTILFSVMSMFILGKSILIHRHLDLNR